MAKKNTSRVPEIYLKARAVLRSKGGDNWVLERGLSPWEIEYLGPKRLLKFERLHRKYWKLQLDVLERFCEGWNSKTSTKSLSEKMAFYQSTITELDHRRGYLAKKVKSISRKLEIALNEFEKTWRFRPFPADCRWKIYGMAERSLKLGEKLQRVGFRKGVQRYNCDINRSASVYFHDVDVWPLRKKYEEEFKGAAGRRG